MLSPGTKLGPYEIVGSLGAGGMGEVYKARDTRLQRDVAIKVLPGVSATDPERLARFEREAQAVAALSHPNILAIHDFGVAPLSSGGDARPDRVVYAVTELLEGETLRERIAPPSGAKGITGLPVRKIIDYGVQIARGLGAAHDKGLVHRDLKPENIFIGKDGHVKILDFGLARQTTAGPASGVSMAATFAVAHETIPGVVLGTIGYMSPEQVRGEPVDARGDIFAFGAVLYEMMTGRRAFQRDTAAETMTAILKEDPPQLTESGADLSPALDRIVRHCLEKSPAERFQSARDIAFALQSLSGSSLSAPSVAASIDRRRRWLRPVLALLAVGAAVAVGVAIGRTMSARPDASVSFAAITFEPQFIVSARFAPDGQTIVYSAALEGNTPELFVSRPGTLMPQPLGVRPAVLLSVSSKGELAVLTEPRFLNHRNFEGTLARMPIDGAPRPSLEHVRDADWSPDGSALAVVHVDGFKDRLEYPIGTVLYETSGYVSDVRVSPDGAQVAFMDHARRFDDRGFVKTVDRNRSVRTVAGEFWGEQGLAWSPNGRTVLFGGDSGDGTCQVHEAEVTGRTKPRVALPSIGNTFLLDVSRDGRWLVTRNDDVLSIRGLLAGSASEREFPWLNSAIGPRLSNDGTMFIFTDQSASAGKNYAVALRKNDGSGVVRIGEGGALAFSPDDKWALAQVSNPSQNVIYPLGPGEPKRLDHGTLELANARWLPDGKAVIVCGNEPARPVRCYTQDLEGGSPKPFSPEGVVVGAVAPDGRMAVAYTSNNQIGLWRLGETATRPVPGVTREDVVAGWSRDSRSLLIYKRTAVPARLERLDVGTGRRTLIREIAPPDRAGLIALVGITTVDDARAYAYTYWKRVSTLIVVKGAR